MTVLGRILSAFACFALVGFSGVSALAQARPSIYQVSARQHDLGPEWESIKTGLVSAIAYAIEAYEGPIYFLARDMEITYDLAMTILPQAERARLKIIHVSRLSIPEEFKTYDKGKHLRSDVTKESLKGYLEQQGITEEFLANGKILLFDSGLKGTIPNAIEQLYPEPLRDNILRHYLFSGDWKGTSTWSFVDALTPGSLVNRLKRTRDNLYNEIHRLFKIFEGMPKYEPRTASYERDERTGRWKVVKASPYDKDEAGVAPEKTRMYMEDVKFFGERHEVRMELARQRHVWREIVWLSRRASKSVFLSRFKSMIDEGKISPAMKIDVVEYLQMRRPSYYLIREFDIGETPDLIAKYPTWEAVLRNPHFKILDLMQTDLVEFERLISEVHENRLLQAALDAVVELPRERQREVLRIVGRDVFRTREMFSYYFGKPHSLPNFDMIPELVLQNTKFPPVAHALDIFGSKFAQSRMDVLYEVLKPLPNLDEVGTNLLLTVLKKVSDERQFDRLFDTLLEDFLKSKRPHASSNRRNLLKLALEKGSRYDARADLLIASVLGSITYPGEITYLIEIVDSYLDRPAVGKHLTEILRKSESIPFYERYKVQSGIERLKAKAEGPRTCKRLLAR